MFKVNNKDTRATPAGKSVQRYLRWRKKPIHTEQIEFIQLKDKVQIKAKLHHS